MLLPKKEPIDDNAIDPSEAPPSYDASLEGQNPPNVSDSKRRSDPDPSPNSPSGSTPGPSSLPPPSNFLHISKLNGSIKGTWTIDPTLVIPESMLSPLPSGETERLNLHLDGYNGSLNADVHLVSGKVDVGPPLSRIKVQSHNGGIELRIHRTKENPRFKLDISGWNGGIQVSIPRNFHGPIFYKTLNGSTKFTPSMESEMTVFSSESRSLCRAFIGDWQSSGFGDDSKGPWAGDEIHVEAKNGGIKFKWADIPDEEATHASGSGGGWIKKLFGSGSKDQTSTEPPKPPPT